MEISIILPFDMDTNLNSKIGFLQRQEPIKPPKSLNFFISPFAMRYLVLFVKIWKAGEYFHFLFLTLNLVGEIF